MEIRVAQSLPGDTVHAWRGYDAEPLVVRHYEQHIGRAHRRHDMGRPPRRRLGGSVLNDSAELRVGRWKLLARYGRGGAISDALVATAQWDRQTWPLPLLCSKPVAANEIEVGNCPVKMLRC